MVNHLRNLIMEKHETSIDYADRLLCNMVKNWHEKFAFRMLRLRCICGYPPKMYRSQNVRPKEIYYHCGNNTSEDECKFFVWHSELHHFQDELCHCGEPTVALPPNKTNKEVYYVCNKAKYGIGCKFFKPLT